MLLQRITSNPDFTIDQYGDFAWITLYSEKILPNSLHQKLMDNGILRAVKIHKKTSTLPTLPEIFFGEVPEKLIVEEYGIKFEIRTTSSHPGLFLDHQLTRKWLLENAKDKSVLNLFSYTASMTMTCAIGGSIRSASIDLSGPTTQWAKKNSQLNKLGSEHQFIKGDVFDWTKRFKKKRQTFDIVICDPPSQSRSDQLHFTTQKHLDFLHECCLDCLNKNGTLITSINTETISSKALLASVQNTAQKLGRKIASHDFLQLPKGFDPSFRSMKGLRIHFSN